MTFIVNQMLNELYSHLTNYVSSEDMLKLTTIIFDALYLELQVSTSGQDRLQILKKHYVNYAQTDSQIVKLK